MLNNYNKMNNCSQCTISLSLGAAGAVSHLLDNVGAIPVKNKEDSSLLNIDDYKKGEVLYVYAIYNIFLIL